MPDLVTVREAAEALAMNDRTLRRWIELGKVQTFKLPTATGAHLLTVAEVERVRTELLAAS